VATLLLGCIGGPLGAGWRDLCPLSRPLTLSTGLGTGELQIMMADEAVAAAWESCAAAREELGGATAPIVRRAVALGRQLLDPLALLAALCGGGKEVLALPLHPLQAQVGRVCVGGGGGRGAQLQAQVGLEGGGGPSGWSMPAGGSSRKPLCRPSPHPACCAMTWAC
jgi:hypothetical protein